MTADETETMDLTNCLSYFDGCNTCMVSGGIIGGCTKMFCQEPAEPQCLEYIWTGMDLSGCVSYFDGCNNCSVENGRPSACTLMYCETPSEPKCNQYASGSEMTGASEKEVINTDFVNDWISVSYQWIKINVDANSFKLLNDIFFKDKKGIYTIAYIGDGEYALKKMDTINPSTFQVINSMFVKDDTKVYAVENSEEIKLIPLQADINSSYVSSKFPQILSDKNNTVYYQNNKFTGISMQELENQITEHWADFIVTNDKVYINTAEMWPFNEYMILPDADTQTFKKSPNINGSTYEDKNNKYDFNGVIISGTIKQLTETTTTITTDQWYITATYTTWGKNYLKIDYVEFWPTGDGWAPEIINNNPLIRTFEIANTALFNVLKYNTDWWQEPQNILWNEFKTRGNGLGNPDPYNPTYYGWWWANWSIVTIKHDDQKIYKVTEEYRP